MGSLGGSILLLCKAVPPVPGGLERYSGELARAYARAGLDVDLVDVSTLVPGVVRGRLSPDAVLGQAAAAPRLLAALAARLARRDYAFAHATIWRPALPLLALGRSVPLAISVHGREIGHAPWPLSAGLRRLLARARALVCVSHYTRHRLVQLQPATLPRAIVAWNGLSATAAPRVSAARPADAPLRVLTVCRLVERKNVATAIRAVATAVRRPGLRMTYTVIGDGPLRQPLAATASDCGLGHAIRFLGRVPDDVLARAYAEHDVFLHPQIEVGDARDFEGFGLTVADAMAAGLVVIAGAGGGPGELVRHGETGLLVDGRDGDEIAALLARLAAQPAERERLAERARTFALGNFTWSGHVERILTFMDSAAGTPRREAA
jgi:glycosyltransferase involved in cell wall biosynthesis